MTKQLSVAFLTAVIIFGLLLVNMTKRSVGQASTEEIGILSSDTTWTKANSPYSLTGPVDVKTGVTLTIEAGVTVDFNSYYIQVDGVLSARGTDSTPIYIAGGSRTTDGDPNYGIIFTSSSGGWNEYTGTGSIIEYASLKLVSVGSSVKISHSIISDKIIVRSGSPIISENNISSVLIQGGSPVLMGNIVQSSPYYFELFFTFADSPMSVLGGSPLIVNNTITRYSYSDQFGRMQEVHNGIYLGGENATVTDNVISGDFNDAAISIVSGISTIERNLIGNHFNAPVIKIGSSATIQNNTINGFTGLSISGNVPQLTIAYNNLQCSSYNVYLNTPANISAINNYWGTTDIQAINRTIYDFKNDFNLGTVNFTPYLLAPNPDAPESIPASNPTPTSPQPDSNQSSLPPSSSPSGNSTRTEPTNQTGNTVLSEREIQEIVIATLIVIIIVLFLVIIWMQRRSQAQKENTHQQQTASST
jgi:hypothetical protein